MELLCDRKSGESPESPWDFLSSSGDPGDFPDFSNMADDDSEHGNSEDDDHDDFGGQGQQEGGGARKRGQNKKKNQDGKQSPAAAAAAKDAAKKKKKDDACCAQKGNQLGLEQRKMCLVSSMMFVVLLDGNHRDKHSAQTFLHNIFQDLGIV